MTTRQALAFVKLHGIVLESAHVRGARGRTFADAVVGARVRGNWWSHPKGQQIFALTRAVRDSGDVLVCRLVDGKITYVHRRLWPALIRLASEIGKRRLDAIQEMHTATGQHVMRVRRFPAWSRPDVRQAARRLSKDAARKTIDKCCDGFSLLATSPQPRAARTRAGDREA